MMRALRHRLHRDERGAALVMAMMLLFIIGAMTILVANTSMDVTSRTKQRQSKAWSELGVASGIAMYQHLLNASRVDETTGYVPRPEVLTDMITSSYAGLDIDNGDHVVADVSTLPDPFQTPPPTVNGWSDVTPYFSTVAQCVHKCDDAENREFLYWQVIAVQAADFSTDATTTVWFRSWMGLSAEARATYTMVRYRPGYFSDYQMLVNGPIAISGPGGITIKGKVHSNGYDVGHTYDPSNNGYKIWTEGASVTCDTTQSPKVTTANGGISTAFPAGCNPATAQKPINFVQVGYALKQMHNDLEDEVGDACGIGERVICVESSTPVSVVLNGTNVTVNGASYSLCAVPAYCDPSTRRGYSRSVLVRGADIVLTQTAAVSGRLTVAAEQAGSQGGDIYLRSSTIGSVSAPSSAATPSAQKAAHKASVLGLVAQGNIIVDAPITGSGACTNVTIHAALVSQSGTLTLDPLKATQHFQQVANVRCFTTVNLQGSLSANRTPQLRWTWPTGQVYGYDTRLYSFDSFDTVGGKEQSHLRVNPPPFYPHDGRWEIRRVKQGNVDCLPSNSPGPNSGCTT